MGHGESTAETSLVLSDRSKATLLLVLDVYGQSEQHD